MLILLREGSLYRRVHLRSFETLSPKKSFKTCHLAFIVTHTGTLLALTTIFSRQINMKFKTLYVTCFFYLFGLSIILVVGSRSLTPMTSHLYPFLTTVSHSFSLPLSQHHQLYRHFANNLFLEQLYEHFYIFRTDRFW